MELKNDFNKDLRIFIDKSGITLTVGINVPRSLLRDLEHDKSGRVAKGKKFYVFIMSKKITSGYDIMKAYWELKRMLMVKIRELKIKKNREEISFIKNGVDYCDRVQLKINFFN